MCVPYVYDTMSNKFRGFCYTLNNYTESDIETLRALECRYHVFGKEVGEKLTPHLQGFIYFDNPRSFGNKLKTMLKWHIEPMRGTPQQASEYCKKSDPQPFEKGELPHSETVNKWDSIKTRILEGCSLEELFTEFPQESIMYNKGMRDYFDRFKPKHFYSLPLPYRPFQQDLIDLAQTTPHPRNIVWIYDKTGNAGKSDLATHLMCNNGFLVLSNAKSADIAYVWNGQHVIFDYSRSQQEVINYSVIEDIKNGRIFSPKYESGIKLFSKPHIFVFANFEPDLSKMTEDRWDVRYITKEYKLISMYEKCV